MHSDVLLEKVSQPLVPVVMHYSAQHVLGSAHHVLWLPVGQWVEWGGSNVLDHVSCNKFLELP